MGNPPLGLTKAYRFEPFRKSMILPISGHGEVRGRYLGNEESKYIWDYINPFRLGKTTTFYTYIEGDLFDLAQGRGY